MVRVFLGIQCLLFLAFGLAMMYDPVSFIQQIGVEVSGRHGAYEMRGIYGGVSFGIAILAAFGALFRSYTRPALFMLVAYMGGYILARGVGIHFDGMPEPSFWMYIGFELVTLVLAIIFLRRLSR